MPNPVLEEDSLACSHCLSLTAMVEIASKVALYSVSNSLRCPAMRSLGVVRVKYAILGLLQLFLNIAKAACLSGNSGSSSMSARIFIMRFSTLVVAYSGVPIGVFAISMHCVVLMTMPCSSNQDKSAVH